MRKKWYNEFPFKILQNREWMRLPLMQAPVTGSQPPPEQWLQSNGSRPINRAQYMGFIFIQFDNFFFDFKRNENCYEISWFMKMPILMMMMANPPIVLTNMNAYGPMMVCVAFFVRLAYLICARVDATIIDASLLMWTFRVQCTADFCKNVRCVCAIYETKKWVKKLAFHSIDINYNG